jgi:creatinine amidohydrolase
MHEQRYELMRPQDIVAARDRASICYVPLGPLEWHGPHLPLGVDMLHAYTLAREAAKETGGVVMPPLPLGTETYLSRDRVRDRGFNGDERIVGMDFPGFSLPSLYVEDSAFGVIVHEVLRTLKRQQFKVIAIINGHGGKNHLVTLDRIVDEETEPRKVAVRHVFALTAGDKGGHAERGETAFMLAFYPDSVDLAALPPLPIPLKNTEFGILDHPTCAGEPTPDFTVRPDQDPRHASAADGRASMTRKVLYVAECVREALATVA